jgi:hypothetical protein
MSESVRSDVWSPGFEYESLTNEELVVFGAGGYPFFCNICNLCNIRTEISRLSKKRRGSTSYRGPSAAPAGSLMRFIPVRSLKSFCSVKSALRSDGELSSATKDDLEDAISSGSHSSDHAKKVR